MLVRAHVVGETHDTRTIAVEWNGERHEHDLIVRRSGLVEWPSAPDDESDLAGVFRNVAARTPQRGDSVRLGRALFSAVLGAERWWQILAGADSEDHIEIRLRWRADDAVMNAQHWELLHDGHGFLAVAPQPLAIVREIDAPARDRSMWQPVQGRPARILFAIGSELHDTAIRPAAEFLALLRELGRSSDHLPRTRFIESASLERLAAVVDDFDPDVVHLAAHGGAPPTGAFLEMRADDGDGSTAVTATQLTAALQAGTVPPMVVLSACTTGRVTRKPEGLGVAIAPFAATLVANGVPAVIGMSGEVTDRTCRLFARRFGSSLVNGERLALAASDARRAAFQNQEGAPPDTSVDWALPSLFVPSDMPARFAPVDASSSSSVRHRIETGYGISLQSRHRPVFAGRLQHVEVFGRVMGPTEPGALLLHGPRGVGVNRLRDELAIFALCEGALLVRVPLTADDYPQNYAAALLSILLNTDTARSSHGLPAERVDGGVSSPIANSRLGRSIAHLLPEAADYDTVIRDEMEFTAWTHEVKRLPIERVAGFETPLTNALLADLATLVHDLGGAGLDPGPIVLDLPELDKWGGAMVPVFEHLLKSRLTLPDVPGDDRVRVMATYRDNASETDEPGRLVREHSGPRLEVLPVGSFTVEEERIAIPWVLLHPYGEWSEVIVPHREESEDEWFEKYRNLSSTMAELVTEMQGVAPDPSPVFFVHTAFAKTINHLRDEHHLLSDDYSDAALLLGLGETQ